MEKRLIQITLVIRSCHLLQEYNLSKRTDFVYDVNTTDENGQRFYFSLIRDDIDCEFAKELLLPEWITENKKALLSVFRSVENVELISEFHNN